MRPAAEAVRRGASRPGRRPPYRAAGTPSGRAVVHPGAVPRGRSPAAMPPPSAGTGAYPERGASMLRAIR
ncbi:MAG: hypothetical protein HSCHL_1799 [Hydrogenibacillus schlegelii]|uniref:Uncharacterized protein n=1 Tax=Hydrogenibacillus schlegelii TaxID=1484 RepID=A0A2T5GF90_HYDSH|nr:MAG: hypothetical protein HSCHL_1799 [Hydrogenibacillus schlegelii]